MANTKWKTAYDREAAAHNETKKLETLAHERAEQHERNMWSAQRTAQVERAKFEEAERQKLAAISRVDELLASNARLQAERDLLLQLIREAGMLRPAA